MYGIIKNQPTLTYHLDTRDIEPGYGIVKVRVTYMRQPRVFTTGIKIKKDLFNKLKTSISEEVLNPKVKDKQVIELYHRLYIFEDNELDLARQIVQHLGKSFTFKAFSLLFKNPEKFKELISTGGLKKDCVLTYLQEAADYRYKNEKEGTADGYISALNSLKRFLKSLNEFDLLEYCLPVNNNIDILPFRALTTDFLKKYERWMLAHGKASKKVNEPGSPATKTTVGMYVRNIRAVYNTAIEDNIIDEKFYPFGKRGYKVGISRKTKKKKVEEKPVIEQLLAYRPEPFSYEDRSWSIWVFSYLSNGMNVGDICRLKKKEVDFEENKIYYQRQKTIDTVDETRVITTRLFPVTLDIIKKWSNQDPTAEYLFPFLNETKTEKDRKRIIRNIISVTNDNMLKIAKKLGIKSDLKTGTARDSFATTLMRSGAPLAFISEQLGHGSLETTKWYLAGFEDEQEKNYLKVLQ